MGHQCDPAPEAAAEAAGERRRIGLLGGGCPVEFILAAGCLPVAIAPAAPPHELASRYLGPSAPPNLAGRLERLLTGELAQLALAIATSRHELDAFLYHAAKEVLRRGEGAMFPPLHLHSLLGDASETAAGYSLGQARRLADRLASVTGRTPTEPRLAEALDQTNRLRRTLARLQRLRFFRQVPGVEATSMIKALRSLPPDLASDTLDRALEAADGREPARAPRILLMSSSELHHADLHAAVEAGGGYVVLEDGDWGARAFGPEIQPEAGRGTLETLVESYRVHTPGLSVYPHTRRHAWFYAEAARPEVDAIVFHIPLDEAALGWDHPRLKAFAEREGKPTLLVRDDPLDPEGGAQIASAVRTFIDGLSERRA